MPCINPPSFAQALTLSHNRPTQRNHIQYHSCVRGSYKKSPPSMQPGADSLSSGFTLRICLPTRAVSNLCSSSLTPTARECFSYLLKRAVRASNQLGPSSTLYPRAMLPDKTRAMTKCPHITENPKLSPYNLTHMYRPHPYRIAVIQVRNHDTAWLTPSPSSRPDGDLDTLPPTVTMPRKSPSDDSVNDSLLLLLMRPQLPATAAQEKLLLLDHHIPPVVKAFWYAAFEAHSSTAIILNGLSICECCSWRRGLFEGVTAGAV